MSGVVSRSRRVSRPSNHLTNPNRSSASGPLAISSHSAAVTGAATTDGLDPNQEEEADGGDTTEIVLPTPSTSSTESAPRQQPPSSPTAPSVPPSNPPRTASDATNTTASAEASSSNPRPSKHAHVDDEVDVNGMHKDIHIEEISSDDDNSKAQKNKDQTKDLKHFFTEVPRALGVKKTRVECNLCIKGVECPKKTGDYSYEHSSLCRHMAAKHKGLYRKWCKKNNFFSMLPEDTNARKVELAQKYKQTGLEFDKADPKEKVFVEQYSDEIFKEAAIQWLIETDQPIQAFEHPSYQRMIAIAAQATRGVAIPNRKQTRQQIINSFKSQMRALRARLNSAVVSGEVSLTCDAWQASNVDAYFAVTGHWTEQQPSGEWTSEEALLGFVRMNTAHNGTRLGQVLFKICDRMGIVHKIGHITCDNASNNNTMLAEFALRYRLKTGKRFDVAKQHIRCLAHIINLATQVLISTQSKSKYYSAHNNENNNIAILVAMDESSHSQRDEVGLIWRICVKACSSSQCKQLFKQLQIDGGLTPQQLLLDMRVRWGSTYVMLACAEQCRGVVDEFITEIGQQETNLEKRKRLYALQLDDDEWERVSTFCNLLSYTDTAQQAFSYAKSPSLHNALPAIEALHVAWSKKAQSDKEKYVPFKEALMAATAKLKEYYTKTAASDAHILSMVLHPAKKMAHLNKYWNKELRVDVVKLVEEKFVERYKSLNSGSAPPPLSRSSKPSESRIGRLVKQHLDTDSEGEDEEDANVDPSKCWKGEFDRYMNTHNVVPKGMDTVRWWGVCGLNRYQLRQTMGAPAGYLDPYPQVFEQKISDPDPQRLFPTDHLDPQVKYLWVVGTHR